MDTEIPFYSKDDYEGIEERDSEITVDEQENEADNCLNVIYEAAGEKVLGMKE